MNSFFFRKAWRRVSRAVIHELIQKYFLPARNQKRWDGTHVNDFEELEASHTAKMKSALQTLKERREVTAAKHAATVASQKCI
eukprot:1769043-Amphidinium_carterae.1